MVAMASELEALERSGISGAVQSGLGKTNAAMRATEMILGDRPDCIINSGVAGSIDAGAGVRDIVIGEQCAYHDVWCGEPNLRGQIQDLPQRFDADASLVAAARSVKASRPVHCGLICTGDRFIQTPSEVSVIKSLYSDGLACDMESAAIAQVCLHFGVPFLSCRIISDVITSTQEHHATYAGFWKDIAEDSFDFLYNLIRQL